MRKSYRLVRTKSMKKADGRQEMLDWGAAAIEKGMDDVMGQAGRTRAATEANHRADAAKEHPGCHFRVAHFELTGGSGLLKNLVHQPHGDIARLLPGELSRAFAHHFELRWIRSNKCGSASK